MSKTRYGRSNAAGGSQNQGERKDDAWQSRQGGSQSNAESRPSKSTAPEPAAPEDVIQLPPPGTNTQGELAGIREAAQESADRLERRSESDDAVDSGVGIRERNTRRAGTDQPVRMGGPLGPDRKHPHLPEGAQNGQSRNSGAGSFDRGVDASNVGAVHQGAKPEDR